VPVKEFLKLVNIWRRYGKSMVTWFFGLTVYYYYYYYTLSGQKFM